MEDAFSRGGIALFMGSNLLYCIIVATVINIVYFISILIYNTSTINSTNREILLLWRVPISST